LAVDEWGTEGAAFAQERGQRVTAKEKAASADYLATAASVAGAVLHRHGIVFTELTAGSGASPHNTDSVKVHYRGTLQGRHRVR
jgi:FKBP-type peptidyl-prolyl cis-trans isomerase